MFPPFQGHINHILGWRVLRGRVFLISGRCESICRIWNSRCYENLLLSYCDLRVPFYPLCNELLPVLNQISVLFRNFLEITFCLVSRMVGTQCTSVIELASLLGLNLNAPFWWRYKMYPGLLRSATTACVLKFNQRKENGASRALMTDAVLSLWCFPGRKCRDTKDTGCLLSFWSRVGKGNRLKVWFIIFYPYFIVFIVCKQLVVNCSAVLFNSSWPHASWSTINWCFVTIVTNIARYKVV